MKQQSRTVALAATTFVLMACSLLNNVLPATPAAVDVAATAVVETMSAIEKASQQPSPAPQETVAAPSEPAAVSEAANFMEPCTLVTKAEAEAILGEPANDPRPGSGCSFTNAKDSLYALSAAAAQEKDTAGIMQGQAMLLGFGGVQLDETLTNKLKLMMASLDYTGFFNELIGASANAPAMKARLIEDSKSDLVYWAWLTAQGRVQGAYVAVRGQTMVNINLVVADTKAEEDMLAASASLADTLFGRLPEHFTLAQPTSSAPPVQAATPTLVETAPAAVDPNATPTLALLSAPRPVSPPDGSVFDTYPRDITLEWAALPGAVNYEVEIEFCDHANPPKCNTLPPRANTSRQTGDTRYAFSFVGAQPGRWRVWAIDANGNAGAKSDWWNFKFTR